MSDSEQAVATNSELSVVQQAMGQMITIQHALNTKSYNSDWIIKGQSKEFDYEIAAGDEIHEFLTSLPFAWWSSPKPDRQNCVTELVDAWHFIMSQLLIDFDGDIEEATQAAVSAYEFEAMLDTQARAMGPGPTQREIRAYAKKLVAALYLHSDPMHQEWNSKYVRAFFTLCLAYEVSLPLLYTRYVAKATLNEFRQQNGYSTKPRTYVKVWEFDTASGEDNFFLSTWIDSEIEKGNRPDAAAVHAWLTKTYAERITPVQVAA